MTLLLFNYAMFNDPTLTIIGWIIAGLEAVTAVLHFIRAVFRNNKKIAESLDKAIAKCENTLTTLKKKQSEYRAIIAYEAVERGEISAEAFSNTNTDGDKANLDINENSAKIPADIQNPPADGVEIIAAADEPENPTQSDNNASYELFLKFCESVKKND